MKMKKLLAPVLSLSLLVPALSAGGVASAAVNTPSPDTAAVELRASLDYLLSEHFTLAFISMTKAYDGASDASLAQAALDKNAKDMVPAITSLYGDETGKEFDKLFSKHNEYTDDIAKATKANDKTKRAFAVQADDDFASVFGSFLARTTGGKLQESVAQQALLQHEHQVTNAFDAYAAGNYTLAYSKFREGLAYMFAISQALSTAITDQFPTKFSDTAADTPAGALRSTLSYFGAEHYALATIGMQKGLDKSPAYAGVLAAEDENTANFRKAIASLYGDAAGAQFEQIWTGNHINAQDQLVKATLAGDTAAAATARSNLNQFAQDFGSFLSTATENKLTDATSAALEHERLVVEAFDIYKSSDKSKLYSSFDTGYSYMFRMGKSLATAIVAQDPAQFEVVIAPTTPSAKVITLKVGDKKIKVDGVSLTMDVAPSILNGYTYVSLSTLTKALGVETKYLPESKQVTVKVGTDLVVFKINSKTVLINNEQYLMDSGAYIINGRTQVPLRVIAELLGWDLSWNKVDGSVTLMKSDV